MRAISIMHEEEGSGEGAGEGAALGVVLIVFVCRLQKKGERLFICAKD